MPDDGLSITPPAESVAAGIALSPAVVAEAGRSAFASALVDASASVVRRLTGVANLPPREVADGVSSVVDAEGSAGVSVSTLAVPLIRFLGTVATPAGVSVLTRRGDARRVMAGTFIPNLRDGRRGVFVQDRLAARIPYAGDRPGPHRGHQPIVEAFGPSLAEMLGDDGAAVEAERAADVVAGAVLAQLDRRIGP